MDTALTIIIPAYNEEGNVVPLYHEIKDVLEEMQRSYEIVFVDDGSCDQTFQKLKLIRQQDPAVKVIRFKKNFGQSAALRAGFDYATGTLIVTLDADLQNDPHNIPELIAKLEKEDLDVICGWRYTRRDSRSKKFFSKLANRLRKFLTKETIHDSGCTLRVYRYECIKDLELYGELHRYIPAILLWKGYRLGELPVNHRERASGSTKYSWNRIINGFFDLLVVAFWQKYSVRPMHIFGGFGFLLVLAGIFIMGDLFFEKIFYNIELMKRPLFFVGSFLFIIGIQFLAVGILADILLKIYYGQNKRKNYLIDTIMR
jgi:glycosyltransferase involved in cell wall biosynthesis